MWFTYEENIKLRLLLKEETVESGTKSQRISKAMIIFS